MLMGLALARPSRECVANHMDFTHSKAGASGGIEIKPLYRRLLRYARYSISTGSAWASRLLLSLRPPLAETGRRIVNNTQLIFIFKTLLLALAYYASGTIGALLAVPSGYAAPIWPPSGVALSAALLFGYSALPGIFLGSFLVNLWTSFAPLAGLTSQQSVATAAVLASGASLQAFTGGFLVRRFVGFPTSLSRPRDVVGFLLLAGPVSCLIGPAVGVTSLLVGGVISPAQYPFHGWTWWVGETIAVIVLTPLILIWTAEPREVWQRRRLAVTVSLGLVLILIELFFLYAAKWEQAAVNNQFERRAQEWAKAIEKDLRAHLETLYSIQSFYMVSPEVRRRDFAEFVRRPLERHPSILALSWTAYVPQDQRAIYEESGLREGFADFRITERSRKEQLVAAGKRASYVSIYYIEPLLGNERAVGYDLASNPVRLQALNQARDSGKPVATGWIRLVHEGKEQPTFLVFLPVYRKNAPTESTKQRRENLLGYATGVFRIPDIIRVALRAFTDEEIELTLFDADTSPGDRVAYFYSARQQAVKPFATVPSSGRFTSSTSLDVAGRSWVLNFSPTPAYLAQNRGLQSWAIGAAGLLISALLGTYLLVATGHTYEVEKLARKLEGQAIALTKANKVKDEFLSVISHELRTPLTVVQGYLGLFSDGIFGKVNPKQRGPLDKMLKRTDEQLAMIESILQVTQIDSASLTVDRDLVDLSKLLENLKETNQFHRNERVTLRWEWPADLPIVITDGVKLKQILQHLISNAIKFTEQGDVVISARHLAEIKALELKVSDMGTGISKEALPFIFEKFRQADSSETRAYGGVGVGLYIVKQFAQLLGGEVSVESDLGKGSTFTVRIPTSS